MLKRALDLYYDFTISVGATDNNANNFIPSLGGLRCLGVGPHSNYP